MVISLMKISFHDYFKKSLFISNKSAAIVNRLIERNIKSNLCSRNYRRREIFDKIITRVLKNTLTTFMEKEMIFSYNLLT